MLVEAGRGVVVVSLAEEVAAAQIERAMMRSRGDPLPLGQRLGDQRRRGGVPLL
jgi:hypothetical protein